MIYDSLAASTYEQRIHEWGLKPDRADVIIPACKIVLTALKTAEISRMYVPQIGLSDGIVHLLYEQHKINAAIAL